MSTKSRLPKLPTAGAVLLLAVVLWLVLQQLGARASETVAGHHGGEPSSRTQASSAPRAAGLRVAIDPVSGARVPARARTERLVQSDREALSRSFEGLTIIRRHDGSKYVDLQGRFSSGTWISATSDGVIHTCVTSQSSEAACGPQHRARRMEVR